MIKTFKKQAIRAEVVRTTSSDVDYSSCSIVVREGKLGLMCSHIKVVPPPAGIG